MGKVRPWCGQPSDGGQLKSRTDRDFVDFLPWFSNRRTDDYLFPGEDAKHVVGGRQRGGGGFVQTPQCELVVDQTLVVRGPRWYGDLAADRNQKAVRVCSQRRSRIQTFWFKKRNKIHEFHRISKMLTEFWLYFSYSTLILTEKLQSHFFAVTETLNSDKSDSNQCYSESESAAAHCSHSTVVST